MLNIVQQKKTKMILSDQSDHREDDTEKNDANEDIGKAEEEDIKSLDPPVEVCFLLSDMRMIEGKERNKEDDLPVLAEAFQVSGIEMLHR